MSDCDDSVIRNGERRSSMRDEHVEAIAEAAARKAVRDAFLVLGIDVNVKREVDDFRDDLRFGRQIRKLVGHGMLAAVTVAAAAIAVSAWTGIVDAIKGHQ